MTEQSRHEASSDYAYHQLHQALRAVEADRGNPTGDAANEKVETWRRVLAGMAEGRLTVGSRTPVADTPAWVTLEVAHGGFATGRYLAEGELREHERAVLEGLPADAPGTTPRERLNLYYSSDAGLEVLRGALRELRYEVEVPEEAALPVVAWLLAAGQSTAALELLATLRPLMSRLRFYPQITERATSSGAGVHLESAGKVVGRLRAVRAPESITIMNATLAVWNPLYDALVELWLRTVEGETPHMERRDGKLVRDANGQPVPAGGWPGRRWPGDWVSAREAFFVRYEAALRDHPATGRHHRPGSSFRILLRYLERCPNDASQLDEGELATVRRSLAGVVSRHGAPGEAEFLARRREQSRVAGLPLHRDIAQAVALRISKVPENAPLPSLDIAARPVAANEHRRVPVDTAIPDRLVRKAERALLAPIHELVERGVIGSAEVLAIVLPQLSSQVAAAGIEDESGRELFARSYTAFRRRRSLLLLNLEHQVQLDELPWVAALTQLRRRDLGTQRLAHQTLRDVCVLTFDHFPHTIIPNPLLREMASLVRQAELKLPLVEEIAADIFMGTFTQKFGDAARIARRVLEGTLYHRYYDLPDDPAITGKDDRGGFRLRWGKQTRPGFDKLCTDRAAEAGSEGGGVAKNGAILEQCQILTSYNLAALVEGLELREELGRRGADIAAAALRWIVGRQAQFPADRRSRRQVTKNCAYAWRQAIFFLSFVPESRQREVVGSFARQLEEGAPEANRRLQPAVAGLEWVVGGGSFDAAGRGPKGERRFLGWSCGRHWSLPEQPSS